MNKLQVILAKNIKECRYRLKYSQMLLAEKANVSTSLIASIETGARFPSSNTLLKISRALGLKPYQLFLEDDEKGLMSDHEKIIALLNKTKNNIINVVDQSFNDFMLEE